MGLDQLHQSKGRHFLIPRSDVLSTPLFSEDLMLRLLKSKGAPVDGYFNLSVDATKWRVTRLNMESCVLFTFTPTEPTEKPDDGLDAIRGIMCAVPFALFLWCLFALVIKSCT